jgi:transposase
MDRLKLTSWQRLRLERQLDQVHDARLYRRTLALLALAEGRSVADIAGLLHVTRQSVYNWAEAYTREPRPEALADDDRGGRPRRLGDDEEAVLRALLARSPDELDYADFIEAIQNPKHEQHDELLEWIGEEFDPEAFSPAASTRAMHKGPLDWRKLR